MKIFAMRLSLLFCAVFLLLFGSAYLSPLSAQQKGQEALFEASKLQMLCQAVRFNCLAQGKYEVAKQINCESFAKLERSIPNSYKTSKKLLSQLKGKQYNNYPLIEERIEKLSADIAEELLKIGNAVKKTKEDKLAWQSSVDSLTLSFQQVRDEAMRKAAELPAEQETQAPPIQEELPSTNGEQSTQNESLPPIQIQDPATQSSTGLWMLTILSILIAFVSLGYAYMIKMTVLQRIRQAEAMYAERYAILAEQIQQSLSREDFAQLNQSFEQERQRQSQVQQHTEKSTQAKEEAIKTVLEEVLAEPPHYFAKFSEDLGVFLHSDLQEGLGEGYCFEIETDRQDPQKAHFYLSAHPQHQSFIRQSVHQWTSAVRIEGNPAEAQKIQQHKGLLQQEGQVWKIIEKIRLEYV